MGGWEGGEEGDRGKKRREASAVTGNILQKVMHSWMS